MHSFKRRRPSDRLQGGKNRNTDDDFLVARRRWSVPGRRASGACRGHFSFFLVWLVGCTHAVLWHAEPLWTASPASPATPHPADVAERNRLLDQEIRLAARPQTYLVLDLQAGQLLIKARGLELHRLAISSWTSSEFDRLVGPFYLQARPPISRAKPGSTDDPSAQPIELHDMPSTFKLAFDPPLVISVEASTHRSLWARLRSHAVRWWHSLARLSHAFSDASPSADNLRPLVISLSLAEEDAQSLAWTVTDGMPLLILRKPSP